MRQFLRSLLPNTSPSRLIGMDGLDILRERIIQFLYLITAATGLILFIVLISLGILKRPFEIVVAVFLLAAAIAIICLRNIPFKIRIYLYLTTLYGAGILNLAMSGVGGAGRIFFVVLSVLAVLLLGVRRGLAITFLSGLTLVLFGMAYQNGLMPSPTWETVSNSLILWNWINSSLYFLILTILTGLALNVLLRELHSSYRVQKRLSVELEKERGSLERRIIEKTADLEKRLSEIRTASAISSSISSVEDVDTMLQQVVNLAHEKLSLYYVGVFLLDEKGEYAVLRAGSGEAGQRMLAANHRLQVGGSSMIGQAVYTKKTRIALDVGQEAVRFNNPLLPFTRSEIALPIISRNRVIGAMSVQSSTSNDFFEEDILILQGIADSLAAALDNISLNQQVEDYSNEIRNLNRAFVQQRWGSMTEKHGRLESTYENPILQPLENPHQMEIPISLRDETVGNIILDLGSPELTPEELTFVQSVATQTVLAMETARLLEATQQQAFQEQTVNQLSAAFSRSINIDDILRIAVSELGQLPSVSEVSIHLTSPGDMPISTTGSVKEEKS